VKIEGSVVLLTGANGGIGRVYVAELLKRGAAKIYLAVRNPASLSEILKSGDKRLVPLKLDVTDQAQVTEAAKTASDVTLLINNAGYLGNTSAFKTLDIAKARREMDVNYFGILSLASAFAPILKTAGGGAIVNVASFLSLVTLPIWGTYSASKAAALAATRSLRAELAGQGTAVVAVMPIQVETEMGQGLPAPRVAPQDVAIESLDAVEQGIDEVFPGELTKQRAAAFATDPKALQAYLSAIIPA
jgi:short-subunit dehydrogenase